MGWRGLLRRRRPLRPPASPAPRVVGPAVTSRDSTGRKISYQPERNGRADPGEIVWVRVMFEEDAHHGKDRPVLVVGRRDQRTVFALQLSSQEHHGSQPNWHPVGVGGWDSRRRHSWVRLDRVLELDDRALRRESVALEPWRFRQIAGRLRESYGWR